MVTTMNTETNKLTKVRVAISPSITCLFAAMVLALSACSSTSANWQHSSKPKDQWSKDISACKSQASALIARQIDINNDSTFVERNDLQVQFASHDARKQRYTYFTNCIISRGYRQVSDK